MIRLGGIAAVEVPEAKVEDFRFNVFRICGVDRLAKFLDEQFQELPPGPLEGLAEGFGRNPRLRLLGEPGRDFLDRRCRITHAEVKDTGVPILRRAGFVRLQPRPDPFDDGLTPDSVIIGVRPGGIEEVARGDSGRGVSGVSSVPRRRGSGQ